MGLGGVAVCDSLVGGLGLGDEFVDLPAEPAVSPHRGDGRGQSPQELGGIRSALGTRRIDEYVPAVLAPLLRMLAGLPIASSGKTFCSTRTVKRGGLLDRADPMAGAQLLRLRKIRFLRDNFGNELRAGNNPESEGWKIDHYDSGRDAVLLDLYKKVGEPAINAKMADDAKAWIAEHPQRFLVLCVHRFILFWTGSLFIGTAAGLGTQLKNLLFALSSLLGIAGLVLAVRKRVHAVFLFAALIVFYPLTYYISVPELRYRHAIEPQLLILAAFLLCSLAARF